LLFGFFASYGVFSMANNTETQDFYVVENEISSQNDIYQTISQFFGSSFAWLLNEQNVSEMENKLFGEESSALNESRDESIFDKIYDILDFTKDNDFVKNGKVLKNVMLEKVQAKNNKIKVKIPKDVLVKKQEKKNP